jgi:hypothetical protein
MTALELLMERVAAKQALRERMWRAEEAGDRVEAQRLWVELEELCG